MIKVLLDAAASSGDAAAGQGPSTLIMLAIFAVFIIFWYVIALRPQRKKEKELKAKVDKMRVGDRIITIGGLCGKVANVKDDEVTIMTSAANTLVTFKKSAINNVISRDENKADTSSETKESSKPAAKEEKSAAKTDLGTLKDDVAESASSEESSSEE